jgi:tetratricopeptide (TPR) repeat protein
LGFAYLKLKQYAAALKQFEHARQLNPNIEHALVGIGATYAQMKEYEKAESALREAIIREPEDGGRSTGQNSFRQYLSGPRGECLKNAQVNVVLGSFLDLVLRISPE